MGKLSRDKGKIGEREVVQLLKDWGWKAKRGQQFRGGPDSPDVIHNMVNLDPAGIEIAIEVKWRQQLNLYDALKKLTDEQKPGEPIIPTVFHRKDRKDWLVTLDANDFLEIVYCMHHYNDI